MSNPIQKRDEAKAKFETAIYERALKRMSDPKSEYDVVKTKAAGT